MKKETQDVDPAGPAAALENVTVRFGSALALDRVSLTVARGSVYALLGQDGAGKTTAVGCLLGRRRPDSGAAFLFGIDSWKSGKSARAKTGFVPESPDAFSGWLAKLFSKRKEGSVALGLELSRQPELLILDEPAASLDAAMLRTLYSVVFPELKERSATVFLTTRDPAGIEGVADRIGILKGGRLVVDEEAQALMARFRKIAYKNEMTESRTDYGAELDEFDAAKVKVRGWGIEAVVTDFTPEKFERFRAKEGVVGASAAEIALGEIFIVVADEARRDPR